ncbi:MAG TPA: photosynthetic complex assembly protein PuhC [Xanthomonadales bacterium]|nr:photosynthetic complex assembly protein PuhC [Xanthomonadales bacterium]
MTDHHQKLAPGQRPFPLPPLIGAALLIFVSIASVAAYRYFSDPETGMDSSARVIASRQLRFDDAADGSVIVRDSNNGALVQTLPVGEYGFVRATLRGLVRTRKALGKNDKTLPFLIELRESGRLMLIDPLTSQEVDLWAFGESNARQFVGFLNDQESATRQSRDITAVAVPGGDSSDSEISN